MTRVRPFDALIEAAGACVRGDAEALADAFSGVPAQELFAAAVRHRCAGLLLSGMAQLRIPMACTAQLRPLLQRYAVACALDSAKLPAQITALVRALNAADVPHALLKTAARIYSGDVRAQWSQTHDIDVLVPAARGAEALDALADAGYTQTAPNAAVRAYRLHHHHFAPLSAPGGGKPVEVHVALAPRRAFSTQATWDTLFSHLEQIEGEAGSVRRLDAYGRCVHMLLHGAGLYRLSDAAQIAAELVADPALLGKLVTLAAPETVQRIPMLAVLSIAAHMAGLTPPRDAGAEAYIEWVRVREDLPAPFRGRMHFIDAWYANGGRLRGPATMLAVPRDVHAVRATPCYRELIGRALAALAAYAFVLRKGGGARV